MESKQTAHDLSKALNSCSNLHSGNGDSFLEREVSRGSFSGQNNGDVVGHRSESEDEEVVWADEVGEDEENQLALGMIGRIWTECNVNPNAFMNTIKGIWALKYGLEISNIGKNMFQFQFHHWRDKQKVIEGQPWHFDHYALLLGE